MPGVIGYASTEPIDRRLLEAMAQPMRHRPCYRIHLRPGETFSIGTIDLEAGRQSSIAESADGTAILAVFGTLYEPWATEGNGLAKQLLAKWKSGGMRALRDLNGEYVIAIWNRPERRLTLINDRLGLKRLALRKKGKMFAWASEVKSLAVIPEVSRAIDEQALSELLTFGHLQDERTLLRDVTLLPPASILTWQEGKVSIERYWRYTFRADPRLEETEKAASEFADRVLLAVDRRIRNRKRIGLLLSGGLDSRTLAGMIRELRPKDPFFTWTTGHSHAHDVRFGAEIARVIGSRHTTVEIPETFLQDFGPHYAWVLDGMVTTHGAHRTCVLEALARETDVALIGFLGDILSGDRPLNKLTHISTLEHLIDVGYRYYAVGFDDALFEKTLRPEVFRRIRGLAKETFAKSVQEAPVENLADRVVYTELIQRQRLWNPLAMMDLMGIDCHVATPFVDRDFVDFALTLPLGQRFGKKAYLGMLCKMFPKLARVPRSGDGLPLVHSRLRAGLHWRWVLFHRHVLPKLTGGLLGGHNYATYVHCAEWFRKANRSFIERTLVNSPYLETHFRMETVNRLVQDFLEERGGRDLMEPIAALMSFVLFRQQLERLARYAPQPQKEEILVR